MASVKAGIKLEKRERAKDRDNAGWGVAGSDGRSVGVQSSPTTGSRIMPPGNAVGKKVQEVWKKNGGGGGRFKKKKAFLRFHSLVTRMLSWMWQSAPGEARSAKRQ